MSIARLTAKKLTRAEIDLLLSYVVADFRDLPGLICAVVFGSAADYTMTEASDVDVALIFQKPEEAKNAQRDCHKFRKLASWPMDLLCIDQEKFLEKSRVGGVFFVIKQEGRVLFGTPP